MTFVVDASVAIKWCIPGKTEPFAEQASELLDRFRIGEIEFLVPDIFWAEVGNVLWKAIQRGKASAYQANRGLELITSLELPTVSSRHMLSSAMDIAVFYKRSVYDCLYLALAVECQCELVTADEKLANAVAAYLPVRWLATT